MTKKQKIYKKTKMLAAGGIVTTLFLFTSGTSFARTRTTSEFLDVQASALGLTLGELKHNIKDSLTLEQIVEKEGLTGTQYALNLIDEIELRIADGTISGNNIDAYVHLIKTLRSSIS